MKIYICRMDEIYAQLYFAYFLKQLKSKNMF